MVLKMRNKTSCSLLKNLNSGNASTAGLHRLASLQRVSVAVAAAAGWVIAVSSAGGLAADDAWQIIADMSVGSSTGGSGVSSSDSALPLLPELGGMWVHSMSTSLLCGGPDAAADVALANR